MNANNLMPTVLQFVRFSSALTKRALDERAGLLTQKQAAAAKKAGVLDALVKTNTITEQQKTAVDKMLDSHELTLDLLKNAAARIADLARKDQKAAGDLGQGVDDEQTKVAGDGSPADPNWSLTSPFVGQRSSTKKASDIAMFKALNLPH